MCMDLHNCGLKMSRGVNWLGYDNARREQALWGFGVIHFTESEQK